MALETTQIQVYVPFFSAPLALVIFALTVFFTTVKLALWFGGQVRNLISPPVGL